MRPSDHSGRVIFSLTAGCMFEPFIDFDHITAILQVSGTASVSLVVQLSFDFGELCVEFSMNEPKLLIDPSYGVFHGVDCHLEVVDP